ncbi:MAG: MFS transporter [Opitutales bacterium]|nr:MFS transporter [Opitutales bacterium]
MQAKTRQNSQKTAFSIIAILGIAHFLNDTMQSIINAVYPLLKDNLALTFSQIGVIVFTYQISASIMQPLFGYILDRKPAPYILPIGMIFTMSGLCGIAFAEDFETLVFSIFFSGVGSSILHPEASKLTSIASGGRRGLAQSVFQVGGSIGHSLGPMLAAFFITPYWQGNIAFFAVLALFAVFWLFPVCRWHAQKIKISKSTNTEIAAPNKPLPKKTVVFVMTILMFLVFSKNFYTASLSNSSTFYLIEKFGMSIGGSQLMLFAFLFASALGTLLGGPFGDKYGRRLVIWVSIVGAAPFALFMPYASFYQTLVLSMVIGFIISSAFPAILVYAQELLPMKLGLVSGLFFGFAFGFGGISSAILGKLTDMYGIDFVYQICSFIPLAGMVAYFLPRVRELKKLEENSK